MMPEIAYLVCESELPLQSKKPDFSWMWITKYPLSVVSSMVLVPFRSHGGAEERIAGSVGHFKTFSMKNKNREIQKKNRQIMYEHRKKCATNTLDPEKLLAWGDSQLKKIERERKSKKSYSGNEYSEYPNKMEISHKKRKEIEEIQYTEKLRKSKKNKYNDSDFDNSLVDDNEYVIKKSKNKKKKDKCESVSVNIELKKGDISYETNFSNSNRKVDKTKKNGESREDEVKKIKVKKKHRMPESGKNNESYHMCIKLTKLDESAKTSKENINECPKSKKIKRKKTSVYSSKDEEAVEMEENELLPEKRKKNKKDKHKKSEILKEKSNSEILNPIESTSERKTKKKKAKCSYNAEHTEKKVLSDVNKNDNEVNIDKDISLSTKKKKRMMSAENEDADHPRNIKKKNKDRSDVSELDESSKVIYMSETERYEETKKKKKKKKEKTNIIEDTSNEIYVKKKKKKKDKCRKSFDSDSVFSASFLSTSSYKSDKSGKVGVNFGKSPISLLLSNHELCSSCCGVNNTYSRKVCIKNSNNSFDTETSCCTSKMKESSEEINDTQTEATQNNKQEKIITEVQDNLPPNVTIKQEKIDEPQLETAADTWKKTETFNINIQVKQEVDDTSTSSSSVHGNKIANVLELDHTKSGSRENGNENVGCDSMPVSSNSNNTESDDHIKSKSGCLGENQKRQTCLETSEQFHNDNCETYYNFCDDKFVIQEEIGVNSEVQNQNECLGQIKIEKENSVTHNKEILDQIKTEKQNSITHNKEILGQIKTEKQNSITHNKEILQEDTPLNINHEADSSHPNQNDIITNDNSRDVSKEGIFHHNNSITDIEGSNVTHNPAAYTKEVIYNSMGLNFIPLSNTEQHSNADTSSSFKTNSEIHVTVQEQDLNQFHSGEHSQILTQNDDHNRQVNLLHWEYEKPFQGYQENRSIYFNHESSSVKKSILFSSVHPQFRLKEQVSRLLKVDISQVKFCYYRMKSKNYQDVHVKFSAEKDFERVIRYYANRIRCRSWHVRDDNRRKTQDSQKKKKC